MTTKLILKRCPCSGHEGANPLPVSEFGKDRRRPDGLHSWCRACRSRAARRWHQANPEKAREIHRRGYQANPEQIREKNRRWAQANPEQTREHRRRWAQANPEQIRAKEQRLRDRVLDHYGRACACCGATENLTVDHVTGGGSAHRMELFRRDMGGVPFYRWLVRNGFPDGFQILCLPCNSSKGTGGRCKLDHSAGAQ